MLKTVARLLDINDHSAVSSIPNPPLPPTPPPAPVPSLVALDGQQILDFLREENQRQRDFFSDLFTKTTWVLGVLIAIAGGAAVFLGINTVSGAKQSAEKAAEAAVQERLKELRPQIDREVTAGVTSEFATPKIDGLVQEAARQATATTANKIIRSEVHDQVASAVASEQGTIDRTLTTATENAVSSVQGSIQQHADQAVNKIVDDKVDPELRRLHALSDLSSAVALARAGDGNGFDRLVVMGNDASSPDIQRAARATTDSITHQIQHPFNDMSGTACNDLYSKSLKSVAAYESQLSNGSVDNRIQAARCLGRVGDLISAGQDPKSVGGSMDLLFHSMSEDPSLNVREAAFQSFTVVGGWVHTEEGLGGEVHLFDNAANRKWWKENRARFISPPSEKP